MAKFWNFLKNWYILLVLILIYIPLIVVLFLSFTNPSIKGNITNGFDWNSGENYINLFKDSEFLNALFNTFIIIIFVVPISLIIAIITCFGIWNSKHFYKNIVLGSSKTNIVIPDIITGISLAILFSVTWLSWFNLNLGFVTIILAHISFCTPYAILIIFPRMQKMKRNLILASQDLGYSKIKTFFKVTIPFIMPAILSAGVIVLGMSFDDFIITKLVGGKINTISTEYYNMAKGIKAWAVSFGALLITFCILISFVILAKKIISNKKLSNSKRDKRWIKKQKHF